MTISGRIGVDIGGTFTDAVLEPGGINYTTKVLTDYHCPIRFTPLLARGTADPVSPEKEMTWHISEGVRQSLECWSSSPF
jgi:hypothetical protein